jgi:hypothetical protein
MTYINKNEVKWRPTDTGALLDVEAVQRHYAAKGEPRLASRLLDVQPSAGPGWIGANY